MLSSLVQGGTDVPTLTDCAACTYEINTGSGPGLLSEAIRLAGSDTCVFIKCSLDHPSKARASPKAVFRCLPLKEMQTCAVSVLLSQELTSLVAPPTTP